MMHLPLDSAGRIAIPAAIAHGLLSRDLALASRSARHLLLSNEADGEVSLAGSIGDLQVAEVLSIINMFRKSGHLHVRLEEGSKDLFFADGELVSASSTFPEEELGEFLLAAGKIDRDTLIKARQAVGSDALALRAQLLQTGLISPKDLWTASSAQIEAIVYHLLPCTQGDFVFIARRCEAAAETHVVLSLQNLIMEGLRRDDERQFFMRTLRSKETMPVATERPVAGLTPEEERLLALASSGRRTVHDLIARSGLGEFRVLSLLHRLVEKKFLSLPALAEVEVPADLAEIIAITNGVLAALYQKIYEKNHGFGLEMRRFLRDLPQPFGSVLRNVTVTSSGSIAGERIVANLAAYPAGEQRALLAETMSELVFMACMVARRDLGETASSRLVEQAEKIAVRLNQLKERKNP